MRVTELPQKEIDKWYAVAIGEIGIPPADFYNMTIKELELAYEGYTQKTEDLVNLILLAITRSQTCHRNELFKFVGNKGYSIGDYEDRHRTFATLGIKEEN